LSIRPESGLRYAFREGRFRGLWSHMSIRDLTLSLARNGEIAV
jgi:hypothetical protein